MKRNQTNLTALQLTFFIIQAQIGVGILGLPFNVFSAAKQDSWISILFAGVVIQLIVFLMWGLGKRFPENSLFEYSSLLTGKFFGMLINLLYIIFGLMVASLVLMYASTIIKMWVLPITPKWIIILLLTIPAVYLGKEKVSEISNIFVVVSALIGLLIVISFIVMFTYPVDWRYLFPIGHAGLINILKGTKEAYFSMLGFELLLILYPYFQQIGERKVLLSVSLANFCVTLIYTFLTIVSVITFSPEELLLIPQPVLYFVKSLYLQIVERIDLVFVSLWVVNVITSLTTYLFLSTEGCSISFSKHKKFKRYLYTLFFGALAGGIALIPNKESEIETFNKGVVYMSYLTLLVLPILLLGLSFISKGSKKNEK
ncbi:GerAB/ArcD/ProY family transporter [Bacillus sp. CH30_1T]|uniref:GerAB/ArcD/ProY family transporter n=1 Tax=Bacillus sp. CH30_1T TaxID=2604836 RepID=UPI0011F08134|nr:GerAB/ArcD/ProY family transporter [Bacillus sp. CH30_1T]KAA0563517.1 GerAB/ArcD/ProY family transporter [Bacillus sp. CH30_1T]